MSKKERPAANGENAPAEVNEHIDAVATPTCGVIRPIAPTEGYAPGHWAEVGEILAEAIREAGFEPRLVSDAEGVAVIHGTIVQNIFEDPIIVCDVSSRNPNVMFELGMRLAFDKPVVIVKDEVTNYSFDTGGIEHIPYPKSLHYHEIGIFKETLRRKISSTAEKAKESGFSPFLKHFRHISPRKLQHEDVPFGDFIVQKLEAMDARLTRIAQQPMYPVNLISRREERVFRFEAPRSDMERAHKLARTLDPTATIRYVNGHIVVQAKLGVEQSERLHQAMGLLAKGLSMGTIMHTLEIKPDFRADAQSSEDEFGYISESHPLPK